MKRGKTPELDQCTVELLKKGGRSMVAWLVRFFNCCFKNGGFPRDCCRVGFVPLYKGKGDRCECSNSRGISLLSAAGKLYGRMLIGTIWTRTDGVLRKEQCGFRSGRGCVDKIFVERQLCESFLAEGKDLFWALMDPEKAYDRVDTDGGRCCDCMEYAVSY